MYVIYNTMQHAMWKILWISFCNIVLLMLWVYFIKNKIVAIREFIYYKKIAFVEIMVIWSPPTC